MPFRHRAKPGINEKWSMHILSRSSLTAPGKENEMVKFSNSCN